MNIETGMPSQEKVYEGVGRKRLRTESEEYAAKKKAAEAAYDAYGIALAEGHEEDIEAAKLEFGLANRRLELFDLTHDSTGAKRGELFGKELSVEMEEAMENPAQMEALGKRFLFVVNMGELDRLNKEGGHKGGDLGLEQTAQTIEAVLQEQMAETLSTTEDASKVYQVYRLSGNEFAVKLLAEVAPEKAAAIREAFQAAKPKVPGIEDAPPLCARALQMKEVMEMLPGLDTDLTQEGQPEAFRREVTGITKDLLFTLIEEEKLVTRVERLAEKMQTHPDQARAFFEDYLKKSLKDLEIGGKKLETYEDAAEVIGQLPQDPAERWEAIHAPALQASIDQLHRMRDKDRVRSEKMANYAKQLAQAHGREGGLVGTVKTEASSVASERILTTPSLEVSAFVQADPAQATEGLRKLEFYKQKIAHEAVAVEAQPDNIALRKQAELIQAEYEIERAKRDTATGLELKGMMYRTAQEAFASGKSVAAIGIDMGFLKYFDRAGGAETGDAAILKSAELFDRACLQGSVRLKALKMQGKSLVAKAFRPGGDEFTILVTGEGASEEDLQVIVEEMKGFLLQEADAAGEVPAVSASASPDYHPTKLMISLGSEVFVSSDAGKQKMEALGIPLEMPADAMPQEAHNALAERLFQVADLELEIQKTYERFRMMRGLAERLTLLSKETTPEEQKRYQDAAEQYKQLLTYSKKALGPGGETRLAAMTGVEVVGGELKVEQGKILTAQERVQADAALLLQVFETIDEHHGEAAKEAKGAEQRVELIARVQFAERQIGVLKQALGEAHQETDTFKKLVQKLEEDKKRLSDAARFATQEKDQIAQLRAGISA